MTPIKIRDKIIGPGQEPFLIAEAGINHGGCLANAQELVRAAAVAGADALKIQAFNSEEFLAPTSDFFDVLKSAELKSDDIRALHQTADECSIPLFASVFDEASAELMASLGTPAFKVASGDLTHLPLLAAISKFGKPMIVSTGGATMGEIEAAISAIRTSNPETGIALLHCVSNYPTQPSDTNLACMHTLAAQFGVPVGFSDHTMGEATAIAAVALGASIIEKHFTLDRNADGPDHALSSDLDGLKLLAEGMRVASQSVGSAKKAPVESSEFIPLIRRSMNARRNISKGEVIASDMVAVRRPGTGISPAEMPNAIGRRVNRDISEGVTITWDMIA